MNEDKCPVCGSEANEYICVDSETGWSHLHMHSNGSINLACCLKCGLIYMPKRYLANARMDAKKHGVKV